MEIERKFLIKALPENLSSYQKHVIEQAYLCTDPVIRIRRQDHDYYLTYKGKGLHAREEYNLPLTQESYEHLSSKIDGILIEKSRYLIPLSDGLVAELDIFEGKLSDLVLVEVEFESIEEANSFIAPEWFGRDVTGHPEYQNSSLSRNGLIGLDF